MSISRSPACHARFCLALLVPLLFASPASLRGQTIHTVIPGPTDSATLRLPIIAGDTIERFFERAGEHVPAGVFFIQSSGITQGENGPLYIVASEFHDRSGSVSYDTVAMSAVDFRPIWERVHAPTDSASVNYERSRVRGFVAAARQPTLNVDTELDPPAFPSYRYVLGMLPLEEGYQARIPVYNMWTSEQIWVHVKVTRRERVSTSSGPADTWVLEVRPGEARDTRTFWIDADTGREVMQVQFYPDGRKVWQIRR